MSVPANRLEGIDTGPGERRHRHRQLRWLQECGAKAWGVVHVQSKRQARDSGWRQLRAEPPWIDGEVRPAARPKRL